MGTRFTNWLSEFLKPMLGTQQVGSKYCAVVRNDLCIGGHIHMLL